MNTDAIDAVPTKTSPLDGLLTMTQRVEVSRETIWRIAGVLLLLILAFGIGLALVRRAISK